MFTNRPLLYRLLIGFYLTLNPAFLPVTFGQAITLTEPIRQGDGSMRVTLTGRSDSPVVLQRSADMRLWVDLASVTLDGNPVSYDDREANGNSIRYYRVKDIGKPPVLPEFGTTSNSIFTAGEGFNTIQYAKDGRLGFIFWEDRHLKIRERHSASEWREQVVASEGNLFQMNSSRTDYGFQPPAVLLYDSKSDPHIFRLNGNSTVVHLARTSSGNWFQQEVISNPTGGTLSQLVAEMGPNDVVHLATISSGEGSKLTYGSNKGGQWNWSTVSNVGGLPRYYLAPSYAPRTFSLAVDSRNGAHLVFRPEFSISYASGGYVLAHNELMYASDQSGQWRSESVLRPSDNSGESGNGASIAIGPNDQPYIASWYNERAEGGSAQWSRLFYHERDSSGTWSKSIVVMRPDGYVAGDGEKGAGFAPYLRFDSRGRPHILFSDHASEHFWNSGQSEYAGQIRHAYWNGTEWVFQTLFRQSNPMKEQMIYPAFAVSDLEIAFTGVQRFTTWDMAPYLPGVSSDYRFVFGTKGR